MKMGGRFVNIHAVQGYGGGRIMRVKLGCFGINSCELVLEMMSVKSFDLSVRKA